MQRRNRSAGPWVHLEDVDVAVLDRELNIHQANYAQLKCYLAGLTIEFVDDVGGQGIGWQGASGVAGVDAGLLNVLHDPDRKCVFAVGQAVNVNFDGIRQVAVNEEWTVVGNNEFGGPIKGAERRFT